MRPCTNAGPPPGISVAACGDAAPPSRLRPAAMTPRRSSPACALRRPRGTTEISLAAPASGHLPRGASSSRTPTAATAATRALSHGRHIWYQRMRQHVSVFDWCFKSSTSLFSCLHNLGLRMTGKMHGFFYDAVPVSAAFLCRQGSSPSYVLTCKYGCSIRFFPTVLLD